MTKAMLRNVITGVVLSFFALIAIEGLLKFVLQNLEAYQFVKDFIPLYIAAVAAYLAYCFQRRNNLLAAVRDLWREIIITKNRLIAFTYIENPEWKDFAEAQQRLYDTIDLVRGVYINQNETKKDLGFYPFEQLHDIRKMFANCAPLKSSPEIREKVRFEINKSWYSLKYAYLHDLPRVKPSQYTTALGTRDPRHK